MIRHAAGEAEATLHDVEAVHRVIARLHAAALGELARVQETAGLGVEEIGIEADDALGLGEMVEGLDVATEGGAGGGRGRLVLHRLKLRPDGPGKLGLQLAQQAGPGRGAGLLRKKREAFATVGRGGLAEAGQQRGHLGGRGVHTLDGVLDDAVRIVKVEHGSLGQQRAGATVWGVARVALELGRATLVGLGEQRDGRLAQRHRRREIKRETLDHTLD